MLIRVKRIYNFLLIHASFVMFSHVSTILLHHFYAFCRTNLLTRCLVPVSYFDVFSFQKLTTGNVLGMCWKFTRIFYLPRWIFSPAGSPWGTPTGQGRPPAAACPRAAGGTRPCSWWVPSATSDAYKIRLNPKTSEAAIIFQRSHPEAQPP